MRRGKSLLLPLAGGLLVCYVLLLLGLTQFEQNARRAADEEQMRLGLEKQAAALAYFYSVRKDDLLALAEHRSVTSFFANRDLGMSMQYGLNASLLKIGRAFGHLMEQRQIDGEPVYRRILLREPDGNILVDTHPKPATGLPPYLQLPTDESRLLTPTGNNGESVQIATPLLYKGRLMGHLLAWIDQRLALDHLIAPDMQTQGGRILLHLAGSPPPMDLGPETDVYGAWRGSDGGIVGRVAVRDTPFEILGSYPPAGLSALLSTRWFSIALLVLAALILYGVWITVRMHTDNLVLRAHIDEASRQEDILNRRNQDLQREILQRKEYERELLQARLDAEAASRAKSEFLATMSHELRTPLNGVLGMAQVLRLSPLDPSQQTRLQAIMDSGEALLHIVNDILDFSAVESGQMNLQPASFNLQQCIQEVIDLFSGWAGEKGLTVKLHYPEQTPRQLVGDPGRVRQILFNLVGNAIKFTDQGRVDISVSCLSTSHEEVELRLGIRDTGIGIAPEQRERLFESFTQADSSSTREFGGTGMGLALSKKLVELMNGRIGVDSTPGEGSEFWIELSLPLAEESLPEHAS